MKEFLEQIFKIEDEDRRKELLTKEFDKISIKIKNLESEIVNLIDLKNALAHFSVLLRRL